jgi:hypothetical protein
MKEPESEEAVLQRMQLAAVQPPTKTILTDVNAWVKSGKAWPTTRPNKD